MQSCIVTIKQLILYGRVIIRGFELEQFLLFKPLWLRGQFGLRPVIDVCSDICIHT